MDHWRTSDQKQRWVASALLTIEPRLRRIKRFRHLPQFQAALQAEIGQAESNMGLTRDRMKELVRRIRAHTLKPRVADRGQLPPALRRTFLIPAVELESHRFAKVAGPRRRISVIYNYFAKESTFFRSLESLERQKWSRCTPDDVEVILVDDGTIGENFVSRLPERVLYVWQRKVGYGICRAKNTGARLANGDYLVFLDPDIMIGESFFDAMLEQFDRFGERLVQCGYIWGYHFEGCPDPRVEFGVWEWPDRPTRRFYQVAGGCLALARSLYGETLGFDEDLIYGGVEDLLFGFHLSKLPATAVLFNSGMVAWHIPHPPGGAHVDPAKTWEIVRKKWPEFYEDYIERGLR